MIRLVLLTGQDAAFVFVGNVFFTLIGLVALALLAPTARGRVASRDLLWVTIILGLLTQGLVLWRLHGLAEYHRANPAVACPYSWFGEMLYGGADCPREDQMPIIASVSGLNAWLYLELLLLLAIARGNPPADAAGRKGRPPTKPPASQGDRGRPTSG